MLGKTFLHSRTQPSCSSMDLHSNNVLWQVQLSELGRKKSAKIEDLVCRQAAFRRQNFHFLKAKSPIILISLLLTKQEQIYLQLQIQNNFICSSWLFFSDVKVKQPPEWRREMWRSEKSKRLLSNQQAWMLSHD